MFWAAAVLTVAATLPSAACSRSPDSEVSPPTRPAVEPVGALPEELEHASAYLPIVEPPNPIAHRPPMDNPGGVNGTRPARVTPGLATDEAKQMER